MTNQTQPTTQYVNLDDTLKLLKAELKREFPATRFYTKRSRGTGYGYVSLRWTDGPSVRAVQEITQMYEGSGFDGMTDSSYTITHTAADASGNPVEVKYRTKGIHTNREISPAFARKLLAQVVAYFGGEVAAVSIVEYEGYHGRACWRLSDDNAQLAGEWVSSWIYRASEDATRFATSREG